jgi:hypothetical protein
MMKLSGSDGHSSPVRGPFDALRHHFLQLPQIPVVNSKLLQVRDGVHQIFGS